MKLRRPLPAGEHYFFGRLTLNLFHSYVSAFAFFSNLFSFTAGYVKIGRDFRSLDAPDETTLGTIQAHESDISVDTVQDPSCAPLNMIMTGPSGPSAVALIPNAVVETALPTFSPAPQDPQTQMPRSRPNGQRSARRRSGLLKMTRRVRGTLIPKAAQLKLSTETTFWIKNVMNLCNVSVRVCFLYAAHVCWGWMWFTWRHTMRAPFWYMRVSARFSSLFYDYRLSLV